MNRAYRCSICKFELIPEAFYADYRGGVRTQCKECLLARAAARRAADPEAARARDRQQRLKRIGK
jgi:hypothetical protein